MVGGQVEAVPPAGQQRRSKSSRGSAALKLIKNPVHQYNNIEVAVLTISIIVVALVIIAIKVITMVTIISIVMIKISAVIISILSISTS